MASVSSARRTFARLPSASKSALLYFCNNRENTMPDLSINLRGLLLKNPTLTCSGTCGYAFEYADYMDLSKLGAFVTKSITREERAGNDPARIVEVRAGMLSAIGLANVGLDRFLQEKVPQLKKMPCPVVVNVAGHS